MAKRRVLFVVKTRISYGVSYGLLNSAKFVSQLLEQMPNVESKVVDVTDGNAIDREIASYKPTTVVFEALWATPEKIAELIKKYKKVNFIVRLHSNPTFLANEGIALEWIAKYIELGRETEQLNISTNSKEFCDYLQSIYGEEVPWTPNIYPCPDRGDVACPRDDGWVHVGCFGALRPMKNHLAQALAAIAYVQSSNQRLAFHINSDRIEQRGDEVLKNLRALFTSTPNSKLVEHPWQDHSGFIELVKTMDLGMQVSLTETFNIVAGDFVSCGIPILVSPEITWVPESYKASPTSISSMVEGLDRLDHGDRAGMVREAREDLIAWNELAFSAWKRFLKHY